ncbi:MAG: hypothetical protein ACK5LX_07735 [Oscillospiraceae bacterium]
MIKKIALLLVFVLVAFSFTACFTGGGATSSAAPAAATEEGQKSTATLEDIEKNFIPEGAEIVSTGTGTRSLQTELSVEELAEFYEGKLAEIYAEGGEISDLSLITGGDESVEAWGYQGAYGPAEGRRNIRVVIARTEEGPTGIILNY